jgi:hypothetical protein
MMVGHRHFPLFAFSGRSAVRAAFLLGEHIIHPSGVTREARCRGAEFGRSSEKLARESEQFGLATEAPENRPPPAMVSGAASGRKGHYIAAEAGLLCFDEFQVTTSLTR